MKWTSDVPARLRKNGASPDLRKKKKKKNTRTPDGCFNEDLNNALYKKEGKR